MSITGGIDAINELEVTRQNIRTSSKDSVSSAKKHFVDFLKKPSLAKTIKEPANKNYYNKPIQQTSTSNLNQLNQAYQQGVLGDLKNFNKTVSAIQENNEIGTDLALRKELKKYSREFGQYFMTTMWKMAYEAVKDPESKDTTHILLGGEYIKNLVQKAYGDDGGPLGDLIYERLLEEEGLEQENDIIKKLGSR